MKNLAILLGIFLFLIPVTVGAVQMTIQSTRFYTTPYYIDSLDTAKRSGVRVEISVPDGITSVKSAIVNFRVLASASTTYTFLVDGKPCLNRDFKITTSPIVSIGDVNTVISFDCTNVIDKEGGYILSLDSDAKSIEGSLTGWVDFIYVNKPDNSAEQKSIDIGNQIFQMVNKGSLEVHGTEYIGGDNGKIWVQLVNSTGQYINNAVCQANIYYPDSSPFLTLATMTFLGNGIYYYDFIVPNNIGVYPVSVICYYSVATQTETADAGTILIGDQISGSYTSTSTHNNGYWKIDEILTGGIYRLDFIENFTGITQPALMTDVSVIWWGKWNGGTVGDLTISVYNYTSHTWYALSNTISDTGGANTEVSNTITTTNLTASGLLSGGQMVLRITDTNNTDAVKSQIQTDQFVIGLNSMSGDHIENVKGSSELHISSPTQKPIRMETICGETDTSACSYFTNDNEFDQMEGEIEDNITIFGLTRQGDAETTWDYSTPFAVDCTAIYWIKFYNGTDWIDITDTASYSSEPDKGNCVITIPITLNPNGVYQERYYYHIKMDNYMLWEVLHSHDAVTVINGIFSPLCMQIGQGYNYTFIVPITESTNLSLPYDLLGCLRVSDDIYWADWFYNASLSVTTSGEYESYLVEARLYNEMLFNELSTGTFFTAYGNGQILNTLLNVTPSSNLHYIGGTEYSTGQIGSVSAQFITGTTPILTGTCLANITYPNRTLFITNANMTLIPNSNAIYEYNFTIPSTEGVYITDIKCTRAVPPITGLTAGTFHVSNSVFNNLSSILNYLITINGTTYNINNSQYNSLLSTINSVNSTSNQSLSILFSLNGSVFNLSQVELSHFNQVLALLNEINYSLNTTLEFKLDLINNTVMQINQSQMAYYLSLLGAINSVNLTMNTTLVNYLVYINGTTTQINQSLFSDYMNLLEAINSMNGSINNTVIPFLIELNATSNITLNFVASINQSLLNYYLSLKDFLSSINVTINTTMENKLDLINQTVFQINDSLTALNITANFTGLFDVLASINTTINSTILNEILLTNSNVLNHNSSEYQHFLAMGVLLNDINFGINTTMENKLDFINSTTWQTLVMLNNLTIGNVSVAADVNWTEGYLQTNLLSFSDNIGGEGITLTSETLMCISNTTLQHLINATQCVQGICHTGNSTITETCLRGCANNQCIPTQQTAFGTAIIVALLIMSGIYVAYKAWK